MHLLGIAGQHNGWFRRGAAINVSTKAAAKVAVADVRPHGPIQSATLLTVEDTRVPIGGMRYATEIHHHNLLRRKPGMQQPKAGKCFNIDVSMIAAVATTDALAECACGARDEFDKAVRFRRISRGRLSLRTPEVKYDIN
jgi:hypothetical protein